MAASPSKDLVILSNLLLDNELANGLKGNSHGLGLCLHVLSSLLSPLFFSLDVPVMQTRKSACQLLIRRVCCAIVRAVLLMKKAMCTPREARACLQELT